MTRSPVWSVCLILASFSATAANTENRITAHEAGGVVRFIAPSTACEMQLQVFSSTGALLVDVPARQGNVLDWMASAHASELTDGDYRCVTSYRDLNGTTARAETMLAVRDGHVSLANDDAKLEAPSVTLLAHDGATGSLITSHGDLSFRFGDFPARTEVEHMRLSAAGNLGIGTSNPLAPLDVRGVIRTSGGIQFADGSILMSAEGLPGQTVDGPVRRGAASGQWFVSDSRLTSPVTPPRRIRSTSSPTPQFWTDSTQVHIGSTTSYGLAVGGDISAGGNLSLSSLASTINFGGSTFVHAHGTRNAFLGSSAGNLTLTGIENVGAGYQALTSLTSGAANTGLGPYALLSTKAGSDNVAVGTSALGANQAGSNNTALGSQSLSTAEADFNTATGSRSLSNDTDGMRNTASGYGSSYLNLHGSDNTAMGYRALYTNGSGNSNTAIGWQALNATTGSNNTSLGYQAGSSVTTGSYNIDIGNAGAAEGNTIRIGDANQTRAFISGIFGASVGVSGIPVVIDTNGQLGTTASSRRYKFDIHDTGEASDGLMRLRPVTFRYLAHGPDAPLQYGLIAEEVAEIYPEMVVRNAHGEVETVLYQFLAPMLLNEVQKEHKQIEAQQQQIDAQQRQLAQQQRAIDALTAAVGALRERAQ